MKTLMKMVLLGGVCGLLAAGCGGAPEKKAKSPRMPEAPTAAPVQDGVYAAIDRHALAAPPSVEGSLDRLAAYLARPARNDAEKARAIYRWIADNIAYDVQPKVFSGKNSQAAAEGTLRTRKGLCDGYAALYYELARRSGLEARRIRGYSKGHSYYPGKRFSDVNHEWIAVKIDGDWRLMDPTWGAGIIKGGRFEKKFDPTYFLTPPDYFLFDHLPENSDWQLVRREMKLADFEAQTYPGRANLRAFYNIGIPGAKLRKQMGRKGFTDFPEVYDYEDRDIRIGEAPLTGRLESGEKYSFSLGASCITGAVLWNEGRWHDLERNGGQYQTTYRPIPGVLKLSVQFPEQVDTFFPILIYSVN